MATEQDNVWMKLAFEEAQRAGARGEVPVGAVIVEDGAILGIGSNGCEEKKLALSHAELEAIQAASQKKGAWRLTGATLYVTLEPCLMCAGAIYQARLGRVVFGAFDPKAGALGSLYRVHEDTRLNHRFVVEGGVLQESCGVLLQEFFRNRR